MTTGGDWPPHEHNWVTNRLAIGSGVNERYEVELLQMEGVTHVVDCRDDAADFAHLYTGSAIEHIPAPTLDDGERKDPAWFIVPSERVVRALEQPATRVLFHCHAGINRGPSMLYFLLRLMGRDDMDAIAMIRRARPLVHIGYWQDADRAVARLQAQARKAAR